MMQAQDFHNLFHVNPKTLQQKFTLSRADARQVVLNCPQCVVYHHPPRLGVNPKGLLPVKVWKMDVTHVPEFGRLKYVHVSVDTCSRIIHATPLTGEKASDVIAHCLEAWTAWGKTQQVKTDNGPAYTGQKFTAFFRQMDVQLLHGLPYNSQGQGIVEWAHCTLKEYLQKQKGGIDHSHIPKGRLSLILFTLNFLNLDVNNQSVADRHHGSHSPMKGMVKCLLTGTWHSPDPVLTWARGSVCVFPQSQQDPVWVPECLVRKVQRRKDNDKEESDRPDGAHRDIHGDDGTKMGDPVGIPETDASPA
ncbi:hypothetical protein STEG23_007932 [Scotinomys teguina]